MMIHEITEQVGKHKKRKRIGRGPGSGKGKTAGRGHKGAGSRSGATGSMRASREGGQLPWFRRFPKRGFSNFKFRTEFFVVNIKALDARFEDGAEINPEMLVKVGLVPNTRKPVKILAEGETTKKFAITVDSFSESAREKIEKAGGSATATMPVKEKAGKAKDTAQAAEPAPAE